MIPVAFVILAAGMGTRMRSAKPKVLHKVAGRSMLAHVLSTAAELNPERITVVVGPEMDDVAEEARSVYPDVEIAVQKERLGTADAVRAAMPSIRDFSGSLMVLFGDTPLITSQTLEDMKGRIEQGGGVAVLGFQSHNPQGYGRLILDDEGNLVAIREDADLSPMERNIKLCNSGVMAFNAAGLSALLSGITNNNSKGEYYLTDAIQIASLAKIQISVAQCPEDDVMGINNRAQLAVAEAVTQDRLRLRAMANGATLVAPETVFLSYDTRLGRDVLIEPNVVFGPGVTVEDGVTIRSYSHLEGCLVREFAEIGPYARLRPQADIGDYAKVGNFVEIKKAVLEHGSKVNHLTYIGDARVGARANVGAGTITCNYDGEKKHHTDIGERAFIGSNSSLIAPLKIGDGAYIGSGSVISKDVSGDALAVARAKQVEKENWAAKRRGESVAAGLVEAEAIAERVEAAVPEALDTEPVQETAEAEPAPAYEFRVGSAEPSDDTEAPIAEADMKPLEEGGVTVASMQQEETGADSSVEQSEPSAEEPMSVQSDEPESLGEESVAAAEPPEPVQGLESEDASPDEAAEKIERAGMIPPPAEHATADAIDAEEPRDVLTVAEELAEEESEAAVQLKQPAE